MIDILDNEPKKLALLRIWDILRHYTDEKHLLTQEEIAEKLLEDYGIKMERKAIGRNISLLNAAGIRVETLNSGSYLAAREFDDSELRMLIDSVLSCKYITAEDSSSLISRLCGMSSKYFKSHVKNVYTVDQWSKTENEALFYNIEIINQAIEQDVDVSYEYNKYGPDKKLYVSSYQRVSPYQMILHNQRYYLMGYNSYHHQMCFHRLDHMTNIKLRPDKPATDIRRVKGYERGLDYKEITSTMPYLYTDRPIRVIFTTDLATLDQVVEWFGKDVRITEQKDGKYEVSLRVSPTAMLYWSLQFLDSIEVTFPDDLRAKIKETLEKGLEKYK